MSWGRGPGHRVGLISRDLDEISTHEIFTHDIHTRSPHEISAHEIPRSDGGTERIDRTYGIQKMGAVVRSAPTASATLGGERA